MSIYRDDISLCGANQTNAHSSRTCSVTSRKSRSKSWRKNYKVVGLRTYTVNGSPFFRAVYVSCDHILQPPPFLIHNLFTDTVSIDLDGDGRVDQTLQSPSSYDPADFFLKLPADRKCENTIISQAAPSGAAILFQIFFLLQLFRQITFFVIFFVALAVSQLFHQFSRCIPNMERNRKVT